MTDFFIGLFYLLPALMLLVFARNVVLRVYCHARDTSYPEGSDSPGWIPIVDMFALVLSYYFALTMVRLLCALPVYLAFLSANPVGLPATANELFKVVECVFFIYVAVRAIVIFFEFLSSRPVMEKAEEINE